MTTPVKYKQWELPKLSIGQIIALTDEVHFERRGSMLETAALMNWSDDAKRRLVLDLDRERGLAADVLRWAYTARGTVRIIEESLKLHGNGLKIDDLGLYLPDDLALALRLLGFEPPTEPAKADESGDPTAVPPRGGT